MVEQADTWLLYAINHGLSVQFLDPVFIAITTSRYWIPVWIVLLLWLVWKGGVEGRWCAATLVVSVALLDPMSHHLLKETIARLRPYEVLPDIHRLVGSGGGSFPSNHAMSTAAAATILGAYYRRWRWVFYSVSFVIGFSRLYCGVHWPSDVVCGWALGILAGGGLIMLTRRWRGVPSVVRP